MQRTDLPAGPLATVTRRRVRIREPKDNAVQVLLFLRTPSGGGAEKVMLRLAGGLTARGHAVTVAACEAPPTARDWVPAGVEVVDLRARSLGRALVPLARLLRRQRPDVLLTAVSGANVIGLVARALARTRTPVVVTEHNTASVQRADATAFMRCTGTPALMRWCYPRAAAIVAVSDGVADDLASFVGLPRDRIVAIPNPVVDDALLAAASAPLDPEWQRRLGDRRLIVSAGRLAPHKNHRMLLEGFARLRTRRDDVALAILGDGGERAAIVDRIAALELNDDVLLAGFQANPYAWLARADVLALTSRYEGLPTILIEALACGARVVSADCRSGPAQILDHGRLGALVAIDDVDGLAAELDTALDRGRWDPPPFDDLAPYRPDAVVAAYEEVLTAAVGRRRR